MLQNEIQKQLINLIDPYLQTDWISAKKIKNIHVLDNKIKVEINLGYPYKRAVENLTKLVEARLKQAFPDYDCAIEFHTSIDAHTAKPGIPRLPNVKNIIVVASGKGGVGKSTVSVNLALALADEGAQVGLLDADIYGPSQPTMLGQSTSRPTIEGKKMYPIMAHGIQTMSIGYLVDGNAAMVWRGPMLGKAMEQLIHDTLWRDVDYLIIDLPPGTGDIQLSLCQKIPINGAVLVTTPQDVALIDVRRAAEMFVKLNIPMLGVVENMSAYHCQHCGHEEKIFGEGGGGVLAEKFNLPMLASIPLHAAIRHATDRGAPTVVEGFENDYAKPFYEIAKKVGAILSLQPKDFAAKFPKIVVK